MAKLTYAALKAANSPPLKLIPPTHTNSIEFSPIALPLDLDLDVRYNKFPPWPVQYGALTGPHYLHSSYRGPRGYFQHGDHQLNLSHNLNYAKLAQGEKHRQKEQAATQLALKRLSEEAFWQDKISSQNAANSRTFMQLRSDEHWDHKALEEVWQERQQGAQKLKQYKYNEDYEKAKLPFLLCQQAAEFGAPGFKAAHASTTWNEYHHKNHARNSQGWATVWHSLPASYGRKPGTGP